MNNEADMAEQLFAGKIGEEYHLLKLICPAAPEMSWRVGEALAGLLAGWEGSQPARVLELGTGTGMTTLAVLEQNPGIQLQGLDNEAVMLDQARELLAAPLASGQLVLSQCDALSGLRAMPDASVDAMVSAYTLHNFLNDYRHQVHAEIRRVLRPGGCFINGDRYALDDIPAHTRLIQDEVRFYFEKLLGIGRSDVLEQWIVHLFSDESADHVMRYAPALASMRDAGMSVTTPFRDGVNSLVMARVPE
jgi:ubiquinone/menaquinone biosynthesis C-methylase UbiE